MVDSSRFTVDAICHIFEDRYTIFGFGGHIAISVCGSLLQLSVDTVSSSPTYHGRFAVGISKLCVIVP